MDINITGRHMHITEAISSYAQDKVEGDLSDFPRVESAHVVLDVEKYRHIAEIFVQGANHLRIEGKSESDDMYVSIDGAVEKVVRQLRKARDKVQSHKNQQSLAEAEIEAVEAEKE